MTRHSTSSLDALIDALAASAASPLVHFALGVLGLAVAALLLSGTRP